MILNVAKAVALVVFGLVFLVAFSFEILLGLVLLPLRVAWDFAEEESDWICEKYGKLIEWTTP